MPDEQVLAGANLTILTVNVTPAADAGSAQIVQLGATVTLDGSGSSDPDEDILKLRLAVSYIYRCAVGRLPAYSFLRV